MDVPIDGVKVGVVNPRLNRSFWSWRWLPWSVSWVIHIHFTCPGWRIGWARQTPTQLSPLVESKIGSTLKLLTPKSSFTRKVGMKRSYTLDHQRFSQQYTTKKRKLSKTGEIQSGRKRSAAMPRLRGWSRWICSTLCSTKRCWRSWGRGGRRPHQWKPVLIIWTVCKDKFWFWFWLLYHTLFDFFDA